MVTFFFTKMSSINCAIQYGWNITNHVDMGPKPLQAFHSCKKKGSHTLPDPYCLNLLAHDLTSIANILRWWINILKTRTIIYYIFHQSFENFNLGVQTKPVHWKYEINTNCYIKHTYLLLFENFPDNFTYIPHLVIIDLKLNMYFHLKIAKHT